MIYHAPCRTESSASSCLGCVDINRRDTRSLGNHFTCCIIQHSVYCSIMSSGNCVHCSPFLFLPIEPMRIFLSTNVYCQSLIFSSEISQWHLSSGGNHLFVISCTWWFEFGTVMHEKDVCYEPCIVVPLFYNPLFKTTLDYKTA